MDKIYKAMADGNRRKILCILKKGETSVSGLLKYFDIGQATVSSHLSYLKKSGLVTCRTDRKNRMYAVNWEVFNQLKEGIDQFCAGNNIPDEIIMRRIS